MKTIVNFRKSSKEIKYPCLGINNNMNLDSIWIVSSPDEAICIKGAGNDIDGDRVGEFSDDEDFVSGLVIKPDLEVILRNE